MKCPYCNKRLPAKYTQEEIKDEKELKAQARLMHNIDKALRRLSNLRG